MTDAAGNKIWDAVYQPFGDVYAAAGAPGINLEFPGPWFQLETGLAYDWHRHYDPTMRQLDGSKNLGLCLKPVYRP